MAEEGVGQEKAAVPIFSRRDHTSRQKYDCCAETSRSCQEPVHLDIDMYTLVAAAGDMRAVGEEEEEEEEEHVAAAQLYSISRKGKRSARSSSPHTWHLYEKHLIFPSRTLRR